MNGSAGIAVGMATNMAPHNLGECCDAICAYIDNPEIDTDGLMHNIGMLVRTAFQQDSAPAERQYARDYFLYLWCGKDSPLFDKSKMSTFERYFIADKTVHREEKGNYFKLRDNEHVIDGIMESFGLKGPNRHIINGHVPVHVANGEKPIKANGKLMVIDGGFSEAYHKETGIAGRYISSPLF